MGGSFDHLHDGHKFLIKTALLFSKNIVIGLATENLLKKKKHAAKIENYKTREQNLKDFIDSIGHLNRVEIIPLNDPYGPPIHDPEYEGIIASQETYKNALKINEIRENKNFTPLIIIVIPMIRNSQNSIISSTSIREKLE